MQELHAIFDRLCDGLTPLQRKALMPGRNVCVRAVAGAGKTRVLALRYIQCLLSGAADDAPLWPRQVVAITFTRKAAGELRRRIDEYLAQAERMAVSPAARRHVVLCREQLIEAPIGTIHSFCAALLREYALAAGLDPEFKVLDSRDSTELLLRTIRAYLDELGREPRDSPWRQAAVELCIRLKIDGLTGLIASIASRFNLYLFNSDPWFRPKPSPRPARGTSTKPQPDDPTAELRQKALLQWIQDTPPDEYVRSLEKLFGFPLDNPDGERLSAELAAAAARMAGEVWDRFTAAKEAQQALDFEDLERRTWDLLRRNPGELREALRRRFRCLFVDEFQDTSPVQWDIVQMLAASTTDEDPLDLEPGRLFIVGDPQQAIFGFRNADLRLFRTAEAAVRASNAADGGSNDSSVTGIVELNDNFRSSPEILAFVNAVQPPLQMIVFTNGEATGALKGPRMKAMAEEFQITHLPMTPRVADAAPGSVTLLLHSLNANPEAGDPSQPCEHDFEAELVARRIRALVSGEAGLEVRRRNQDGASTLERPRFGDVAVLVRARNHLDNFESAFLKHGIPFYTIGGKGFFQTPEITDAVQLLAVLGDPTNDIALAAVLRSPLFAFPDTLLLRLTLAAPPDAASLWERLLAYEKLIADGRSPETCDPAGPAGGRISLMPPPQTAETEAALVQQAVARLAKWRAAVLRRSLPALLEEILTETGAWALYRAGGRQPQAVANLEKLIGLARIFERKGTGTLLEFVERLATLTVEEEEEAEAQTEAERADVVRLMTIHAAKGLEFPIVFLPHLNREFYNPTSVCVEEPDLGIGFDLKHTAPPQRPRNNSTPPRSIHATIQAWKGYKSLLEELRLFYVACTRAETHLFLCSPWLKSPPDDPKETKAAKSLLGLLMQTPEWSDVRRWVAKNSESNGAENAVLPAAPIGSAMVRVEWWNHLPVERRASVEAPPPDPTASKSGAGGDLPRFFTPERLGALEPRPQPPGPIQISVSQLTLLVGCPRRYAYYRLLGPALGALGWGAETPLPAEEDRSLPIESDDARDGAETPGGPPAGSGQAGVESFHEQDDRCLYGLVCHKFFELFVNEPHSAAEALLDEAFRRSAPHATEAQRRAWRPQLEANLAAFRQSQIGRAILKAPERFTELPFTWRRDGLAVTGIIDVLFRDQAGRWAFADYKTSRVGRDDIARSAAQYAPQMALNAAFVLARFPDQDAVTATLYYPFPDCALSLEFHRDGLQDDLAQDVPEWITMLASNELEAYPFAPEWVKRTPLRRSLGRLASLLQGSAGSAPTGPMLLEPCPVCPFLEHLCGLPEEQRRVMLARRTALTRRA
ncbi:MAG: hypothetical protein Kow0059_20070 [Candidatus Sumerlaeia bacterium]